MKVVFPEVSLMNFSLRISTEVKGKVKVLLLEVSNDELHSSYIEGDQREDESGVTRSITEKLHTSDIQGDQMEGESGVTRSMIDELHSSDIQGNQMEGESGVTRSIIDELNSSDIQRY